MENCHGGKLAQLAVVHLSRKRCFALSRRRVVLTFAFISHVFSSYHALDFADFPEIFLVGSHFTIIFIVYSLPPSSYGRIFPSSFGTLSESFSRFPMDSF
jgi:hypothetical protein